MSDFFDKYLDALQKANKIKNEVLERTPTGFVVCKAQGKDWSFKGGCQEPETIEPPEDENFNPSIPEPTDDPPPIVIPPEPAPQPLPRPTQPPTILIVPTGERKPQPAPSFELPKIVPRIPYRRLPSLEAPDDTEGISIKEKRLISVEKDALVRNYGTLLHSPITNTPAIFRSIQPETDEAKTLNNVGDFLEYLVRKIHGSEISNNLARPDVLSLNLLPAHGLRYYKDSDLGFVIGTNVLSDMATQFRYQSNNAFQSIDGLGHVNYEVVPYTQKGAVKVDLEGALQPTPAAIGSSDKFSEKVYEILGGDAWYSLDEGVTGFEHSPEGRLMNRALSQKLNDPEQTGSDGNIISYNLIDYITDINAVPYYRLGAGEFPAQVPPSLSAEDDEEDPKQITNYGKLFEWYIEQFDALTGQFPIEIDIEDNDLVKTGGQKLEIRLPNISETLSDLIGHNVMTNAKVDALLQASLSNLGETGSTRILGIKNNSLLWAISDYLGFAVEQELETVPFSFNPIDTVSNENQEGDESISTALTPKEQDIEVTRYTDKDSLESQLAILVEAARIIKGSHFRGIDIKNNPKGQITDILKGALDLVKDVDGEEEDFSQWLDKIENEFGNSSIKENPDKPYGKSYERRPKARDISTEPDQ